MSGLQNTDASSSSKQEHLDLQDYPPDGDTGVSAHVFTGDTSFQGNSPKEQDSDLLCGWGSLKPKAIQVFNTPRWVLFFLSVASFLQGLIINGFTSTVVTSIEKRFDLSSSQTGLIISAYDIASCVCLPFSSYFGGNGHKPRWLGWGILIMGLGSLVFALPHFTTPSYQVTALERSDLCSANSSDLPHDQAGGELSNYYLVFMLGQILQGIGTTPLYTLGFTFLDENVNAVKAPIYMGFFYSMGMIGPGAGLLLGGYLLSFYSEITVNTDMTPSSPQWVGAWWIGFVCGGALCLPVGFAVLGYPKKLPGNQTLLTCSAGHHTVYSLWPRLPGDQRIIAILTPGSGTFLGSYFVKRFKLQIRGMIWFCLACTLIGILLFLIFLMHCPNVPLAGVTMPYATHHSLYIRKLFSSLDEQLSAQCNSNCSCDRLFSPVCGADHRMYFSPCYAGCTSINLTSTGKVYTDCSCVLGNVSWGHEGLAIAGRCETSCSFAPVFMIISAFTFFLLTFCYIPAITSILRCVPEEQKSFALGIQWILVRTLGAVPGPIVSGALIDQACLLWQKDDHGSCLVYENSKLSLFFLIGCIVGAVFYSLALVFYRPPPHPPPVCPEAAHCGDTPEDGARVKQQTGL
uniref:Kazal-like domain-containing protein n=1 Tax=Periophthalmus magnuspinnatus TaxID=409849 RepID=A0A3B4B7M0_9GOBI